MPGRRILICGGAICIALLTLFIQVVLGMLGVTHSFLIFGVDFMNGIFLLIYIGCAGIAAWGAIGPLPE